MRQVMQELLEVLCTMVIAFILLSYLIVVTSLIALVSLSVNIYADGHTHRRLKE
jgi:hypothetical protein